MPSVTDRVVVVLACLEPMTHRFFLGGEKENIVFTWHFVFSYKANDFISLVALMTCVSTSRQTTIRYPQRFTLSSRTRISIVTYFNGKSLAQIDFIRFKQIVMHPIHISLYAMTSRKAVWSLKNLNQCQQVPMGNDTGLDSSRMKS
jgi:hypothetical protein